MVWNLILLDVSFPARAVVTFSRPALPGDVDRRCGTLVQVGYAQVVLANMSSLMFGRECFAMVTWEARTTKVCAVFMKLSYTASNMVVLLFSIGWLHTPTKMLAVWPCSLCGHGLGRPRAWQNMGLKRLLVLAANSFTFCSQCIVQVHHNSARSSSCSEPGSVFIFMMPHVNARSCSENRIVFNVDSKVRCFSKILVGFLIEKSGMAGMLMVQRRPRGLWNWKHKPSLTG